MAAAFFFPAAAAAQTPTLAERIEACGACHGVDGNSPMEKIPSLAGQPELFIANQLILMREGVRPVEAMTPFVKDLKDDTVVALARHYAALQPKPSGEAADPALAARGAEIGKTKRCDSCHLPTLAGSAQIPRIGKQRIDYLIHSLKQFRDSPHPGADTIMSGAVAGLSDADLAALAHYAAAR
ncbi:MAG: cytochrome c4 [Alphaproteobacteria bacterium]|nr:cytochrome c4 [Alphaproteobacteria bacterium]